MHLLIVEDDPKILKYLKVALKSEMFTVDSANTGNKGLFLAKTNKYDLIMLDKMLPDLTGDQILKKIRETKNTTPILFLTGECETESKVDCLNSGADDYLTKPYSFEELLARIKALLRRPKEIEKVKIKVKNIEIDRNKFTAKKDGNLIDLTRKEFNLLDFLIKNKGLVVSRGRLMENVWDINADPFSNTIESHILSLRKKIDPDKNIVKTIPGRGYIIE